MYMQVPQADVPLVWCGEDTCMLARIVVRLK